MAVHGLALSLQELSTSNISVVKDVLQTSKLTSSVSCLLSIVPMTTDGAHQEFLFLKEMGSSALCESIRFD